MPWVADNDSTKQNDKHDATESLNEEIYSGKNISLNINLTLGRGGTDNNNTLLKDTLDTTTNSSEGVQYGESIFLNKNATLVRGIDDIGVLPNEKHTRPASSTGKNDFGEKISRNIYTAFPGFIIGVVTVLGIVTIYVKFSSFNSDSANANPKKISRDAQDKFVGDTKKETFGRFKEINSVAATCNDNSAIDDSVARNPIVFESASEIGSSSLLSSDYIESFASLVPFFNYTSSKVQNDTVISMDAACKTNEKFKEREKILPNTVYGALFRSTWFENENPEQKQKQTQKNSEEVPVEAYMNVKSISPNSYVSQSTDPFPCKHKPAGIFANLRSLSLSTFKKSDFKIINNDKHFEW
eukprot:CAMPEP_0194283906 /NCGR_PEP_ID=MMETSP0169-20130528/26393_1 /TAXON_ID=218684 /ORGANISM="Corethron pennatum, Strain L29A3" /LENGTH=354 /DNA_ID=CAMNT_0039029601 /DNA_START=412 /DNA_END=1473 /DNA_ORIENTATION=-